MPIILAQRFPYWEHGGTTATLYLYAKENFFAVTGIPHTPIVAGKYPLQNWTHKIDCAIVDDGLEVPDEFVEPTTNSDNPLVKWVAVLVDQFGEKRKFIVKEFRLRHDMGDSVTWEQIRISNATVPAVLPPQYYNEDQINLLLLNLAFNPDFIEFLVSNPALMTAIVTDEVIEAISGEILANYFPVFNGLLFETEGEFSYE